MANDRSPGAEQIHFRDRGQIRIVGKDLDLPAAFAFQRQIFGVDLFPEAIRLVDECRPQAVMLENVRGLLDAIFNDYRNKVEKQLKKLGYVPGWRLLNASDYGVSQLRPRVVFVGLRKDLAAGFSWPEPSKAEPPSVGELLYDLMKENGWRGADRWRQRANAIAPTLVGGSKKHGGPDLGSTRAKAAWALLGVDGMGLWDVMRQNLILLACRALQRV